SKDGENWVDLNVNITLSATLSKVTIDLTTNQALVDGGLKLTDELRIKFVVSGKAGDRVNVDDLTIYG
ncbi:MAG: hypothetical protein PHX62_03925, partial [Bacilli bacterium]|nr:hypothetical protein [Bacilli bacterium]